MLDAGTDGPAPPAVMEGCRSGLRKSAEELSALKAAGMRVVANLKPCLLDDHPRFAEVAATGGFVRDRTSGAPALSQFWDGEGAHLDFSNKAVASMTAERMDKVVGPPARNLTGFEWLWGYFTHTAHHRGQAEVYMRVKNIKPPRYVF